MKLISKSLSAVFQTGSDDNILVVNEITGETIAGALKQKLIARPLVGVSEPVLFSHLDKVEEKENSVVFTYSDEEGQNSTTIEWISKGDSIVFNVKTTLDVPLWMIELTLDGFAAENIIIPALGGQCLHSNMPDGSRLDYKYPFWWNAQFVIAENSGTGIIAFFKDNSPVQKLLRVQKSDKTFALTIGIEAEAPVVDKTLQLQFQVKGFEDGWEKPVEEYRNWMKSAYSLKELSENNGLPGWADRKNIILEMWGAHREMTDPGHTFDQMKDRLIEWSKVHPPEETLVYLPGFAEHGIDSRAPDYGPSPQCGGPEKFKELIDHAHSMGYHVMVHTNVLAMTYAHRLYDEFKKYQVVDVFNRPQGWGMDLDGDWLAEPFFAYMNPGYPAWREHMSTVIGGLIKEFNIDGVFLDQTLLSFNDISGTNFMQGMVDHVNYLRNAFPGILFAGEGLHEFNCRSLPMAQIHGIDSIAGVHGQEGELPWRTVHPVSAYLFKKFTRLTGHLLTKNLDNPMFSRQEASYKVIGALPVVVLYNSRQNWDHPDLTDVLDRARKINKNN